jgi:site-specific recombinase XerC
VIEGVDNTGAKSKANFVQCNPRALGFRTPNAGVLKRQKNGLVEAQQSLRWMVLDSVPSPNSRRNYAKALDDLFALSAGRPLSRALLMEYRATMDALSPSTINVRLSAVRKMVSEARKNGMLGAEEAANLTEVPNIPQKGTRLGHWLTREQARELLAVPNRTTLKGKRDYVLLAMLVGCALRREELAVLDVDTIQLRGGWWVLADLEGKGRRVRTVAIPAWVKQGINAWMTAAGDVSNLRHMRVFYQVFPFATHCVLN